MALQCRPDIHAAQAAVTGTKAAENLARADRIPSPIVGPQYAMDEAGIAIHRVRLHHADSRSGTTAARCSASARPTIVVHTSPCRQAQQRAVAQVRSAVAKWNGASELVKETERLDRRAGTRGRTPGSISSSRDRPT